MLRKLQNGGFITILPPKTAINGHEIVTIGKSSELAIQNCLKSLPSPKTMGDMPYSKNYDKINKTAVS